MTPYLQDPDVTLYHGDVLDVLREMEAESVDCVVTSPPYWGLRDYGTGAWEGGDEGCDHVRPRNEKQLASSGLNLAKDRDKAQSTVGDQHKSYGRVCGKCGATRIDQQLGLEPTPEEYVSRMVEVFREVRRVLASHGTVWLNLGDSYAGYWGDKTAKREGRRSSADTNGWTNDFNMNAKPDFHTAFDSSGIKPKDLVGIPWRVAFALQQPYYAGRIKSESDRRWLAGIVDSEGCIHIHRRKAGTDSGAKFTKKDGTEVSYARTKDTYGVMVSIDNTSKALVDACEAIIGQGSRYVHEKETGQQQRKQTLYRLTLTGQQSRELLRELYPFFIAKRHEARIAYHSPSSGDEAASCHEAIKALHNGAETTVDYKAPPTLYEPGWYLRSDICWAKSNPMPESVTDRPTKAHEYVFLLSKQARYFFDQEAVREPHQSNSLERSLNSSDSYGTGAGIGSMNVYTVGSHPNGRNIRSVWEIATQPYPEAHFATFPEELARRCIAAGCPEQVCRVCGKARERLYEREFVKTRGNHNPNTRSDPMDKSSVMDTRPAGGFHMGYGRYDVTPLDLTDCGHSDYRPGIVLDPFMGSGTVAHVARKLGRRSVGIDLSADYLDLAAKRLQQQSLFALDNGAERSPSAERTKPELTQASADRRSREAVQANKGKVTSDSP